MIYKTILLRDIKLALAGATSFLNLALFFLIATSLFVFASNDPDLIVKNSVAVIWACATLAALIGLNEIYYNDYVSGHLEQLFISGFSLENIVIAKMLSYCLITCLPIMLVAPLVIIMLQADIWIMPYLFFGIMLLSIISSVCAALTLEVSKVRVIAELLLLPLFIPVIIFGTNKSLFMLLALVLFMLPLCVIASKVALNSALKS